MLIDKKKLRREGEEVTKVLEISFCSIVLSLSHSLASL